MARFIARRWYVEHGNTIVPGQLHTLLGNMLPQQLLTAGGGKSRDQWTQAVIGAFDKMGLASNKYSKKKVSDHNSHHLHPGRRSEKIQWGIKRPVRETRIRVEGGVLLGGVT